MSLLAVRTDTALNAIASGRYSETGLLTEIVNGRCKRNFDRRTVALTSFQAEGSVWAAGRLSILGDLVELLT